MRSIIRRIVRLAIFAGLLFAGYHYGSIYLWPPEDRSRIQVVGVIEAPEVNVTSRIAGRIKQLDLNEGDQIKKGQVVARIEEIDLRNQVARARADLARAQAMQAQADRNLKRNRQLFAENIIATRDRDDSITEAERSRADVLSASANVKFYSDQLADTEVRAPIDGVVVSKNLQVGEWVTPGMPIFTVDDVSTIWARVDVEETDLNSIFVGKAAQVSLATNPPENFTGRVMAIGQEGEFATERDVRRGRQDIRTFYVKVQVLQAAGELKPGMTAEVTIIRNDGTRITRN
jgi:HlyD family secretion protein